jgi:hypothetical protein
MCKICIKYWLWIFLSLRSDSTQIIHSSSFFVLRCSESVELQISIQLKVKLIFAFYLVRKKELGICIYNRERNEDEECVERKNKLIYL